MIEVQFTDTQTITRSTLVDNEHLVTLALTHLGTRVSVKTLDVHIQSMYDLMQINVPRDLTLLIKTIILSKIREINGKLGKHKTPSIQKIQA